MKKIPHWDDQVDWEGLGLRLKRTLAYILFVACACSRTYMEASEVCSFAKQ